MDQVNAARRAYDGPIFFSAGFRPFFLSAALFAGIALPLWIAFLEGVAMPGGDVFPPIYWHGHEMIFGYLGAVMGGFALTAIAEWTKRPATAGWLLVMLAALWLAGRIAVASAAADLIAPGTAAAIDLLFFAALIATMTREIVLGRNWKNLMIPALFTIFWLGNLLFYLSFTIDIEPLLGLRLALAVGALLISVIGGRITPIFTRNWLAREAGAPFPAPFGLADKAALLLTGISMLAWACFPQAQGSGALLVAAGIAQLVRLVRWRGDRTPDEPLVFILHVGYGWLVVALLALSATILLPDMVQAGAALHALTAGAIGVMTIAVMTRASLGHTGRKLTADKGTIAIYALVNLGAALRVLAPALPTDYVHTVALAGILWSAGFILFALKYGRYLTAPRVA